jgi:riboflavin biosynthesis pyrimidine reductase
MSSQEAPSRVGLERFEAFVARKVAEATRASLHPFVTEVEWPDSTLTAVGSPWSRDLFDGNFYLSPSAEPLCPACNLVFVQSKNGNTGADDPSTLGGGTMDKHLLYEGLSQVAADAVLAGATTIGSEGILFAVWHPELVKLRAALGKPRYPIQIVATLRGLNVHDLLLFNVPTLEVMMLTVASGLAAMQKGLASRPWVRPIVMSNPHDLPTAFETLHTLGIERVTAVGGRHMATQLIDARLVQDIYLTTSAKAGGEPGTPMYPRLLRAHTIVRKHGTADDVGVRFEHLRIDAPPSA